MIWVSRLLIGFGDGSVVIVMNSPQSWGLIDWCKSTNDRLVGLMVFLTKGVVSKTNET